MKKNRPRLRRHCGVTNEQIIECLRQLGNDIVEPPGSMDRLRKKILEQIDAEQIDAERQS